MQRSQGGIASVLGSHISSVSFVNLVLYDSGVHTAVENESACDRDCDSH
jgi:hypothetical protein